jgi:hypothetical protein
VPSRRRLRLAAGQDVLAREADVVRAVAPREADLRGEHDVVPYVLYGATGYLLRQTSIVDVGVSIKLPPTSRKRLMISLEPSSFSSRPNIMAPRQSSETMSPVLPSHLYSI